MDINVGMIIVITIAFVALVIINRKKAKISGAVGETKVSILLKLLGKDYSLLNDIMLDTNYGTTQIDHIVVSPYGIFVIETKNYQGWILGGENSEYWTQNMYGNKYQFRNPLLQNNAHVNVLRKILPYYANDNFVSIVAFSGKSTLKVNVSEACHVLYISKLLWFIKKYKEVKLNPCQIEEICNLINDNKISSSEVKKKHAKLVKQRAKESETQIENGVCPRCGGSLVERYGKYGAFYGCSNYPKCKFSISSK